MLVWRHARRPIRNAFEAPAAIANGPTWRTTASIRKRLPSPGATWRESFRDPHRRALRAHDRIDHMDKVARTFTSFADADAADAAEDMLLTPEQRIEIVLELQERMNPGASEQGFARVYRITQLDRS